jgi:hypothetical protein
VSGMRGSWISRRNSLKRLVNKATSLQLSTDEKSSLSINNLKIEMKKIKTLSGLLFWQCITSCLLSYYGLIDAEIRVSDKDFEQIFCK